MSFSQFVGSLTPKQKAFLSVVVAGIFIAIVLMATGTISFGKESSSERKGGDTEDDDGNERRLAGDQPPGAISDVKFGVTTDDEGGPTESYTTIDEMDGLTIDLSFVTPKTSFGFGNLKLKDYIISLGTSSVLDDGRIDRTDTLALLVIPRENATGGTKLITSSINKVLDPSEVGLSGDFNKNDEAVTIKISNEIWTAGQIIIPEGGVFLSIDYTSMDLGTDHQYTWSGIENVYEPVGDSTKKFINGGITLAGEVQDDGGFIVNPDVTDSINEQLNIEVEKGDIGGNLEIRKQIGMNSRILISPISNQTNRFLAFATGGNGIKASIMGEPAADCFLDRFRGKPTITSDNIMRKLSLQELDGGTFWTSDSNWYNFAIMEEHQSGWVRLGLISNFEKKEGPNPGLGGMMGGTVIKDARYPVIHPVHVMDYNGTKLSFHKYNESDEADIIRFYKTYVKFVRPLNGVAHDGGNKFSLCVRRVGGMANPANIALPKPLTAEDKFLVYEEPNATLKPLKEISDLSLAVFTKRNPTN
jgi:hypothetical protein